MVLSHWPHVAQQQQVRQVVAELVRQHVASVKAPFNSREISYMADFRSRQSTSTKSLTVTEVAIAGGHIVYRDTNFVIFTSTNLIRPIQYLMLWHLLTFYLALMLAASRAAAW